MKVLALQGSPRKQGNTATLLKAFLLGMAEAGEHSVHELYLQGLDIRPCRNCDACRRTHADREILPDRYCAIEDDMQGLFRWFIEADLVVFASPIYWWSISSQLKLFIDRLYGLDAEAHPEFFRGKKAVLLFTHYEAEPCSGADLAAAMFREIAAYTEIQIVADLRYCSGSLHAQDCPEKLAQARALGRALAG